MAAEKTIYSGPFVHSKSLTELDICEDGAIGVDETGKIAFVLRDRQSEQVPATDGWDQARKVSIEGPGFFFPGFIGAN